MSSATDPVAVAVSREIPAVGLDLLREAPEITDLRVWPDELPPSPAELATLLSGCVGAVTLLTDTINGPVLDNEPQLKVVSNFAVGFDNINVDDCTAHAVAVCNTPNTLNAATADHTWALLMGAARRLVEGQDYVRAGKWRTWGPRLLLGQDIFGATLGIVGFGRIGREVARRAAGFDMRILAYDPFADQAAADECGAELVDLDQLLRESDFVSLHVALTPDTTKLIGRDAFKAMKKSAILINAARGPVVDTDALVEALQSGEIAGAGLDVTDPEPIAADHPLVSLPNALIVPHIASATYSSRDAMATMAAQNLLAVLRGEQPPAIVNPEVLGT